MPRFPAPDGASLAYRTVGDWPLLVCLPGGPGQASAYRRRPPRAVRAADVCAAGQPRHGRLPRSRDRTTTYRVGRMVDDVEAMRRELGLARIDLRGHSAGGGPALLYAAAHRDRLDRLVLANPSLRVLVEGLQLQPLDTD